eukprot:CAMPEP_0184492630 /NCGR_PEP_ID=MMETSP0113_2-20130426/23856_1 /TAXON_ID=91329 /ORGANISM="Norrisiella sphaerica, Strain BC52" /LENGTH=622 /DNA_ID=CAMNT_0026877545 /DNA_START=317 /DNA_END=2185 /DNA_ORIENTATION=-
MTRGGLISVRERTPLYHIEQGFGGEHGKAPKSRYRLLRRDVIVRSEKQTVSGTTESRVKGTVEDMTSAERPAEIRNWVRLEDGRFQGEVFNREGIKNGKVIATSSAKVLESLDRIQTDTGAIYKLVPSYEKGWEQPNGLVVGAMEEDGEEVGAARVQKVLETLTADIVTEDEITSNAEENYDPFKALIKGLGAPGPSSKQVEDVTSPSSSVTTIPSSPSPPSAPIPEIQHGDIPETVTAVFPDPEEEAENVQAHKLATPPASASSSTSQSPPPQVPKPEISQSQSAFTEILGSEVEGGGSEGFGSQGQAAQSGATMEPPNLAALAEKTTSEVETLALESELAQIGVEEEEEEQEAIFMPEEDVRKQSLAEDQLMNDQIASDVTQAETKIAKKGTNWLSSLIAKGSAALVNSPVSVNNQFNTIIQYNFGEGSKGKSLSECKSELLVEISGVERGLKATEEAQNRIEKLVRAMEAGNPTKTPLKNPLLNGRWALLYTTAKSVLGEGNPLKPRGPIYQSIDIFGLRILNEQAYEPLPFVRWTTSAAGDLMPKSNSRAEVKFETFRVGGVKVSPPPSDPARRLVEWELEVSGKGTPAWIDNTYVDENLRVVRDYKGNLFVMKRDDP